MRLKTAGELNLFSLFLLHPSIRPFFFQPGRHRSAPFCPPVLSLSPSKRPNPGPFHPFHVSFCQTQGRRDQLAPSFALPKCFCGRDERKMLFFRACPYILKRGRRKTASGARREVRLESGKMTPERPSFFLSPNGFLLFYEWNVYMEGRDKRRGSFMRTQKWAFLTLVSLLLYPFCANNI